MHMQRKHKDEWNAIQEADKQAKEDESRLLLRQQTAAMERMAGARTYACDCGQEFGSQGALNLHRKAHKSG